jgi:hypothetical protein
LFEEFGAANAGWQNRDERANVGINDVLTSRGPLRWSNHLPVLRRHRCRPPISPRRLIGCRTLVSRINRRITELERKHNSLDRMVDVLHARDRKVRKVAQ